MPNISASVNLKFTAGGQNYGVNFTLPSSEPSDEAPITFEVQSLTGQGDEQTSETFAMVAVGGDTGDDGKHFYVHIAPPASIMPDKVSEIVKEVGVSVACGTFKDGKFAADSSDGKKLPADEPEKQP